MIVDGAVGHELVLLCAGSVSRQLITESDRPPVFRGFSMLVLVMRGSGAWFVGLRRS